MLYIIIAILFVIIIVMWLDTDLNKKRGYGSGIASQYDPNSKEKSHHFNATLKALEQNKVVVVTKEDGIYVRLAGDANKGEAFRYEFAKVVDFSQNKKSDEGHIS